MTNFTAQSSSVDSKSRVLWRIVAGEGVNRFFGPQTPVKLTVPATVTVLTREEFYELREAVEEAYDHIRQEQPSD